MSAPKINLYNVPQLRTIADENLSDVLGSLGYTESFLLTDIKLGLGIITVALSGGLFLLDKKVAFRDSYIYAVVILGAYFVVSGILYYLSSFSRENIKYEGTNDSGKTITIVTNSTKYDPTYYLEIRIDGKVVKTKVEFTQLFDNFTSFHPENLKAVIGKEIQVSKKKDQ